MLLFLSFFIFSPFNNFDGISKFSSETLLQYDFSKIDNIAISDSLLFSLFSFILFKYLLFLEESKII